MAAAGDDAPAGLFSGVWSRLHAAASLWRRRGQASRDGEREEEDGEATVRSRLARRAAAARRVGRKLAFVSFNLEVLVFIYAFWRARRRSLTWRQPIQVLPVLAVPALATLIYAAFVRFTRMLDLKDKRTLERLQEDKPQNECEPRESVDLKDKETLEGLQEDKQQTECGPREFDRNNQNNVQNCDDVEDASNSLVGTDSAAQTAKLMKHRQSSIKHRDDGGADMAWGHSKDFQSAPSGGLRMRRLSSSKTYMTSSSFIERSVEKTQETPSVSAHSDQHVHVPVSTEDTISYPFDDCRSMHVQPADTPQELSEGDADEEGFDGLWDIVETRSNSSKENPISPVGSHNIFYDGDDSRSPASPPDDLVAHNSLNDFSGSPDLSGPVLPASETLKMLPPESVREEALLDLQKSEVLHMYSLTPKENPTPNAVNDKELPITPDMGTYSELLGEGVEETESSMFHIPEESMRPFISEEVLLGPVAANSIEHCLGTPEFSLCGQETEKLEVVGSAKFTNGSPESSFLSSPELVVESAEDAAEKELCELNTKEENAMLISMEEPLQDPLIVSTSTSEQCLESSDVSLCIQDAKAGEVSGTINFVTANHELMYTASPVLLAEGDEDLKEDKTCGLHLLEQNGLPINFEKEPILDSADTAEDVEITEVHDVVKEGLFESEGEETFTHGKLGAASSNADSNTENLITDSIGVQIIPNPDINEALEGGWEAFSEPLHHGTRHSAGMFLSSGEINNDVYSLAPMEIPTSYAVNGKELPITPDMESYPKFFGEGVEEIVSSKFHIPEEKHCSGAPEVSVCGPETEKMEVGGSVSFINVSPDSSFLSSPELVVEGAEDTTIGKGLCELNTKEDNAILINMEEQALQDPLIVSTSTVEQCLETSDFSLCIQDANAREVPGITDFVTANPELMYPASPELPGEYDEDFKEDKMSDSHLPEQNGLPFNFEKKPILDSPVAYTAEDIVKEDLFESEGKEIFSYQKLVVASSDGDSNTQKLITDSICVQFIPNSDINEDLEGGHEAFSEPLHHVTRHSEEIFLSPGEINDEEVYSLTPMESPTLYAVNEKELPITPDVESYPELFGEGVEEIVLSKFHMPEESLTPFNLEEVLPCSLAVSNIENCPGAPEFSVCGEETDKMEVAGSVSFINVSPELSFLSSPELVVVSAEDATEKELCELNTKEDNAILINMEEEALQDPLMVSTSTVEQCLETSDVSLHIQDANPKLMYPSSPEVLGEYNEEFKEDQKSDSHILEQNGLPFNFEKEPILDSPVADTAEDVEITEVHYVVKEGFSESEGEEAFNYQKLAVTDSEDDSDTQNLIIDSMPVKFLRNSDLNEVLEGGQEAFSQPLRQSTRYSEGMFLSSAEINNDEVYSSNSNSYANVVEDAAPSEGLSKFEDEMSIASLDTSICLDEVKSAAIVDIDIVSPKLSLQAELRGGGVEENEQSKFHLTEEITTPFNLEAEVLLSPVAVNNSEYYAETPEFSLYNEESEEMEVVESVSFVKASHESSFLSSPELVAEGDDDAREKETREVSTNEENETLINLEEKPLQAAPVVSTTDQCLETPVFSSSSEETTDVPEIVSFVTVSPELNYSVSPELLAESEDGIKEYETSDLHLHEQKALPFNLEDPFLDPLVVDSAEDALAKSEVGKITEVQGVVEGVLPESEDEEVVDHLKPVLASPDDDTAAQNLISNSTFAQFIPDSSVKEGSQAGQQALLESPHESTCHSEGTFLSSGMKITPFAGQEGLSKSEDEIASTSLEVRTAENLTANSGPSQSIPDSNGSQSLHDQEQAPSETLQDVNFLIEGSHTSSDEGINSEIFSLYSRSSSCVSEINMLESLRSGTSSEPENDRGLSFDERNRVIFHNLDSTENYTNNPATAESMTNMIETLNIADETTAGSPHEVSSNFVDSFVAPDVINGMTQSDQHLDLSSSSFAPVVDAFETLQSGHVFSEPQLENDVTFEETQMSPKEADDAENYFINTIDDPQDSERTSTVALEDEDDLTLHKAYMSPEDISEVENSLADDYASDLPHMPENHCFSEKVSPESQDPLSSEEILVHPEGLKTENDLDGAKSSLFSTEVNLAELWGIAHEGTLQQDETMLGFEEANSEDHYDNSRSLDIPDVTVAESLQAAERSSSEILYDGMFSFEGTLISLDGDDNAEDFTNNSGSDMHTAQTDTTSLPGLQEGSFKPEDENAVNSITPYEVDTEESSSSNRGNSSSASSRHDISFMEAPRPRELPIDAGRGKVLIKDKEPKDGESEVMKETVEDLDDDHEVSSTPSDAALNLYLLC
ncbi:uncharacterized protein LOC119325693 isoform X2 [Triticum dicoccoides]|uniref:uncharacterized protein LOC119325693 isoform X2 n=1 Tax=Triticum dicoccoides TaxID=85692 RepID=UPI001891BD44|nr:uncharacterized protein LOC119325693 isoform X2 [Triticum dicoccoides]